MENDAPLEPQPPESQPDAVSERVAVETLVARFAHLVVGKPVAVIAVALVLAIASAIFAARFLGLDTDRNNLIGKDLPYNQRFIELQQEYGDLASDTVVIEVRGHDRTKALGEKERDLCHDFARKLDERLKREKDRFGAIFYNVPEDAFRGRAFLLLDLKTLEEIAARLADVRSALERLGGPDGVGGFFEGLAAHVRKLIESGGPQDEGPEPEDRGAFLIAILDGVQGAVEKGTEYRTPWRDMMPRSLADLDGYVWTEDRRMLFLVGPPKDGDRVAQVKALRGAIEEVAKGFPALDVGLTGDAVLETDEMETYEGDAQKAMVVGVLGVTLLLLVSYRRVAGPVLLVICLLMAVSWTLAFAAIWPGHLNLLSIVFLMILVGFGIDFGIHLISRYDEERTYGMEPAQALEASLRLTGRACAAGATTTAIAFAAMLLADFQGIREFGILAGAGTIFCLIAMLGVLPAFVVLADRGRAGRKRRPRPGWARTRFALKLDRLAEERPWALIGASLAAVAVAVAACALRLEYDGDLLKLQATGLPSVKLATELLTAKGETGMFAATMVADEPAAWALKDTLEKRKGIVARVSTIDEVVPRDQDKKLVAIARIRGLCEGLLVPGGGMGNGGKDAPPPQVPDHKAGLEGLRRGARAFDSALAEAQDQLFGLTDKASVEQFKEIEKLRKRMQGLARVADPSGLDEATLALRGGRLDAYQKPLRAEFNEAMARLKEECAADRPLTQADLPADVRARFVGKTGKILVRIFPEKDIFKDAPLAEFVTEVRKDVPDVTWVPVQIHETGTRMRDGYERAGRYALLFIALYLLVHYRSLVRAGITMVALLAGVAVSLGLFALCGQSFNPANMLAIPLTLGINVSYAIQLVHRHRQAHAVKSVAGAPALVATSTGRGVLLSAATTVVGFGALMLAHHRGTFSIGVAITVGVLGCLTSSLVFLPALLRAWTGPTPAPSLAGGAQGGPKIGPEGKVARVDDANLKSEPGNVTTNS